MTESGLPEETTDTTAHGFPLPAPARLSRTAGTMLVATALVAGVTVVGLRYLPREGERAALAASTKNESSAGKKVETVAPKAVTADRALVLPGSVQPREETVLYARATGYVHRWVPDIGDFVKEGALLAEIDTPELDQELTQNEAQLAQTKASVLQAKANRDLAETNLVRAKQLAPTVVSQAELDTTAAQAAVGQANLRVAEANVEAQEANIRRLRQLKQFSRLTSPFAGTVTQRSIERGMLVTASNAQPLYKIAATDTVRVFVQVPQGMAPGVRIGGKASVRVREYPGAPFEGTVARASAELDAATRTMTTLIVVPNPDGKLMSGMYADVSMDLPYSHRALQLPATALLSDAKGQRVAVVDGGKVHLVSVVIEQDNGGTIEISSGLTGGEAVIKLANASLTEGEPVDIAPPAPTK